ncbi:MAG TPA: SDR family oxidoreductase [Acidimicrobiales bacterium]|nr:SDR family oxidoreductase [Acidimicrobiales bacterium]
MAVALITGCSSGFGLLAALHGARQGHTVVATMRDASCAGELEAARDDEGLDLRIVALDVTSDASVAAAVDGVVSDLGRIDVLVNNAGLGIRGAVEEVDVAQAEAVFATNVFGVLRVTKAVLPVMRDAGSGVIVNVSSIAGRVSPPFGGIYGASKYALEAVSEALHYEVHPFGIRVAVVEPGSFPTRFDDNRQVADADGSPYDELRARWDAAYGNVPGREGGPADPQVVAEAIWEVATDPEAPLRRLVGTDAELLGALRADLDDDAFEQTVRTALDFWD